MKELIKFAFKINVKPDRLEKYTRFNINNKLDFIFQFLSSSLDTLVNYLGKDHFKYLCQEFHGDILDLVNRNDSIIMSMWLKCVW